MFNKNLKALSAIKGKSIDALAQEEIDAINQELKDNGFESIHVSIAGQSITQADVDAAVADRERELNADHECALGAKDTEIETLQTRVTELEGKATGEGDLNKGGDNAHDESKKSESEKRAEAAKQRVADIQERAKKYQLP